jgi:transcriptional regulator with XRE-family HTH domain
MNKTGQSAATKEDCALGRAVRERRTQIGLTLKQMQPLIGVSWQQIHKYEVGINRMSVTRFMRIAEVLSTTPDALAKAAGQTALKHSASNRALLRLVHLYHRMTPDHQKAFLVLGNALAEEDAP